MPCPTSKPLGPRLAQPTGSNRHHHHTFSPHFTISFLHSSNFPILSLHPHISSSLIPSTLPWNFITLPFILPFTLPIIMSSLALRRFASSRVSLESDLYPSTIVRCHVTKTNPSATAYRLYKQQGCEPVRSTQLDQPVGSLSIAVLIRFPIISLAS